MENELKWYAARIIQERAFVEKFLGLENVEVRNFADLRSLVLLHASQNTIDGLRYHEFLRDKIMFYRDPERKKVQPVPDNEVGPLLTFAPFKHDEPLIYLAVDDPKFFDGPRYKVLKGEYEGMEGTLKRLKGTKRLILKLSDRAAVATPYIPQMYLEQLD